MVEDGFWLAQSGLRGEYLAYLARMRAIPGERDHSS